jgi:hypothetical protein
MRLSEFANAQEQLALWKLISDTVWDSISVQAQAQEQKRAKDAKAAKKAPKSSPIKLSAKRVSPPTPPKPRTPPKNTDSKTDARTDADAKQKSASQTLKPQVLPNVFTSTARSNPAQPQSPVTSASSLSPQSVAQTSSQRVIHDPNSVASIQRQLYPLAFDSTIKKLTS